MQRGREHTELSSKCLSACLSSWGKRSKQKAIYGWYPPQLTAPRPWGTASWNTARAEPLRRTASIPRSHFVSATASKRWHLHQLSHSVSQRTKGPQKTGMTAAELPPLKGTQRREWSRQRACVLYVGKNPGWLCHLSERPERKPSKPLFERLNPISPSLWPPQPSHAPHAALLIRSHFPGQLLGQQAGRPHSPSTASSSDSRGRVQHTAQHCPLARAWSLVSGCTAPAAAFAPGKTAIPAQLLHWRHCKARHVQKQKYRSASEKKPTILTEVPIAEAWTVSPAFYTNSFLFWTCKWAVSTDSLQYHLKVKSVLGTHRCMSKAIFIFDIYPVRPSLKYS